jgi:hypothetical protein
LSSNETSTADFSIIKNTDTTLSTCATGDNITITIAGQTILAKIYSADKTTICFTYDAWKYEVSFESTDSFSLNDLVFEVANPEDIMQAELH